MLERGDKPLQLRAFRLRLRKEGSHKLKSNNLGINCRWLKAWHANMNSAIATSAEKIPTNRHAVIVAGMHRSGTSALTRVFGYCGLQMPRTLVPANEGNSAGHWESELVCQFNDRLLARLGLHWISWQPGETKLSHEQDYPELVREASQIILDEFGDVGNIVLKDPRICRLLSFWLDVFDEIDTGPVVVLPLRAPGQVALSLQRRNGISPAYGLLAWLRFTLEAERASRRVPRVVVSFDQLMQDWRLPAIALNDRLGHELLACTAEAEGAVSGFLSTDLHHFRDSDSAGPIPDWVARAYAIFAQWQERAETQEDRDELDAIRCAFDGASPMFASLVESAVRI